jgi:hypothetical protein
LAVGKVTHRLFFFEQDAHIIGGTSASHILNLDFSLVSCDTFADIISDANLLQRAGDYEIREGVAGYKGKVEIKDMRGRSTTYNVCVLLKKEKPMSNFADSQYYY